MTLLGPHPHHPTPLGHRGALSRAPSAIQQGPTSCLFHSWQCISVSLNRPVRPTFPFFPCLGIYSEKTIIQRDTFTPVFIAGLFIITRTEAASCLLFTVHQAEKISPEYSLEGQILKLKLQYFGLLMRRTDSLEKTLMLGKIAGRRRRGLSRMQ